MGGKKFALLLCAEDSDYVIKKYGGYYGVFVTMLGEEGETWDMFRVFNDEFPDHEEIKEFDGFVISGSCSDAHGNDSWILKLLNLVKQLDALKKKVLGICFGHQLELDELMKMIEFLDWSVFPQPPGFWGFDASGWLKILGRALGGRTGRATAGWEIGVTTVQLSSSKLFTSLKMPPFLSIIECHQDEVWELPPKAEVIAWSNRTGVEMFRHDDHIMGIQGHPEYNKDILLFLIDRRLLQRNLIQESFAEEVKSNLMAREPDSEAWKELCISFLKGRF